VPTSCQPREPGTLGERVIHRSVWKEYSANFRFTAF
jgi:hypothetical protein